jgi:hypothetical protein
MQGSKRNIRKGINFLNFISVLPFFFYKYHNESFANKIIIYRDCEELKDCIFNQVGGYQQNTKFHTEKNYILIA